MAASEGRNVRFWDILFSREQLIFHHAASVAIP